jgi:hypothetical protein
MSWKLYSTLKGCIGQGHAATLSRETLDETFGRLCPDSHRDAEMCGLYPDSYRDVLMLVHVLGL